MSIKDLTASQYLTGLTWSLTKKHLVDTFKSEPYTSANEQTLAGSATVTEVNLDFDEIDAALPISNSAYKSDFMTRLYSYSTTAVWSTDFLASKGVAAIYMATATVEITSAVPILNPTCKLVFSGRTRKLAPLAKSFEDFPDVRVTSKTITDWINANTSVDHPWTAQSTYVNYESPTLMVLPFVRKINVANGDDPDSANMSVADDVLTAWTGGSNALFPYSWKSADYSRGWYNERVTLDNTNGGPTVSAQPMWPVVFYGSTGNVYTTEQNQRIKVPNNYKQVEITLTRINDYKYRVDIHAPVKYLYFAASRYSYADGVLDKFEDLDNLAFYDLVKSIQVDLYSQKLLGDTRKVGYSLIKGTTTLTTTVDDINIMAFSPNPFVRLYGCTFNGNPWTSSAARYILMNHKDGKYALSCNVNGLWALDNDIKVNSVVRVKLLNGDFISKREGEAVYSYQSVPGTHTKIIKGTEYYINPEFFGQTKALLTFTGVSGLNAWDCYFNIPSPDGSAVGGEYNLYYPYVSPGTVNSLEELRDFVLSWLEGTPAAYEWTMEPVDTDKILFTSNYPLIPATHVYSINFSSNPDLTATFEKVPKSTEGLFTLLTKGNNIQVITRTRSSLALETSYQVSKIVLDTQVSQPNPGFYFYDFLGLQVGFIPMELYYYSDQTICFVFNSLSKSIQGEGIIAAFGGYIQSQDITVKKICLFEVKNIQKSYKSSGFTYSLKLLEVNSVGYAYQKVPQTVTGSNFSLGIEYYFNKDTLMSMSEFIGRIDTNGNLIVFRRRFDDSVLAVIEETFLGRVVLNKTAQTLTVYKWITGTTYSTHRTITFADYLAGGELWTIEVKANYGSFHHLEILNNLAGYIETS